MVRKGLIAKKKKVNWAFSEQSLISPPPPLRLYGQAQGCPLFGDVKSNIIAHIKNKILMMMMMMVQKYFDEDGDDNDQTT